VDRLPPGDAEIGVDDVESVGDVDAALRAYYAARWRRSPPDLALPSGPSAIGWTAS